MRLLHAIVVSIALIACKQDQSATGEAAKQAMGLYAKGFNLLIKDPREVIDDYTRTIPKDGPTLDAKPHLFGQHQFAASAVKEARAAFDDAKKAAPASLAKLGPLADRAIAACDKMMSVYADAYKYYDAQSYKDDKLAKGKQLHADMLAAIADFDGALDAMEDGLSDIEDAQAADEIKAHEDNKDYGYWFRAYTFEAKKVLAAAHKGDAAKRIDQFESVHDGFAKFVAGKGPDLAQAFSGYVDAAERFHSAATVFARDGKAAKIDDLVNAYNSLVNLGNSLYQLEGTPAL